MSEDALNLNWVFGFSKDVKGSTVSLGGNDRNALFFLSSHSGVIYDFEHRSQMILQGHCNSISCCAVDRNKRWIVTADSGPESILVVWDALTYNPIKTINIPHPNGVEALDLSEDAMFIVTLSNETEFLPNQQEIAIWSWTKQEDELVLKTTIASSDYHTSVRFNPDLYGEIVSTGAKSVCFWHWEDFSFEFYFGKYQLSDLGILDGDFVTTLYLPGSDNAISTTSEGCVLIWVGEEPESQDLGLVKNVKKANKIIKIVDSGITLAMTTTNQYLVLACKDGSVRFYDYYLRLEAWFEDIHAGPITSLSFSTQDCPYPPGEAGSPGLKFWVPDFIVGTSEGFVVGMESALFDEVKREDRRGTLLMQGMADKVVSISCHPKESHLAIATRNGYLQLWNYDLRILLLLREFNAAPVSRPRLDKKSTKIDPLRISSLSYDTTGAYIVVGFTSGLIKLLHSHSFEDFQSFAPTTESILGLSFSPSGSCLAGYDKSNHVFLFKKEIPSPETPYTAPGSTRPQSQSNSEKFVYLGRCLSHTDTICELLFGYRDDTEILLSISSDRYCVEYDLDSSSVQNGVVCVTNPSSKLISNRLEHSSVPNAAIFYPRVDEEAENRFVVANSEFKFKEFNSDSKVCRKTSIAPRFGLPINKMKPLRYVIEADKNDVHRSRDGQEDENVQQTHTEKVVENYIAFSTPTRIVGIIKLPLDGDPTKYMGIVSHPHEISDIATSHDGAFLFTAGGSDLSVNMWKIDLSLFHDPQQEVAFEDPAASASHFDTTFVNPKIKNYLHLLEGGELGELHRDIIDYFYYIQMKSQGEDSLEERVLDGTIPVDEIPTIMRAIGFYPSEEEINNMVNEIRYQNFMITGEVKEKIDLNEIIILYLNHRPTIPLERQQINEAFNVLTKNSEKMSSSLSWTQLRDFIYSEGDKIEPADLEEFLVALMGDEKNNLNQEANMNARMFAERVLGFAEEFDGESFQ